MSKKIVVLFGFLLISVIAISISFIFRNTGVNECLCSRSTVLSKSDADSAYTYCISKLQNDNYRNIKKSDDSVITGSKFYLDKNAKSQDCKFKLCLNKIPAGIRITCTIIINDASLAAGKLAENICDSFFNEIDR